MFGSNMPLRCLWIRIGRLMSNIPFTGGDRAYPFTFADLSLGPSLIQKATGPDGVIFLPKTFPCGTEQARRTESSSPLGLIFDHGCDAINCAFGIVFAACIINAGASLPLLAAVFLNQVSVVPCHDRDTSRFLWSTILLRYCGRYR